MAGTPRGAQPSSFVRARRGRRPDVEQAAIRERIEQLLYQGLRAPAIHRALTGPEAPNQITISDRRVRAHIAAIERAWTLRADRAHLETEHAKAIALAEELARTAMGRATINARSNIGVGYANVALKAFEHVARLRGLYAPGRSEISGPDGNALAVSIELADHPADHLDPREEARRLRQLAADAEAEADALEDPR